jgi:hypothetical protein
MSGFFGFLGGDGWEGPTESLRAHIRLADDELTEIRLRGGFVGGAISPWRAVRTLPNGNILLVTGDLDALLAIERLLDRHGSSPDFDAHLLESDAAGGAAWALIDVQSRRLRVASPIHGAVPVYFWVSDEAIAFSTWMRPLGRFIGAAPDPVGVATFLREGYLCARRTFFAGVKRLRPGEMIEGVPGEPTKIHGRSRLWTTASGPTETEAAMHALSSELLRAVDTVRDRRVVLMMSGGWDSRTILGALLAAGHRATIAYSHGDPQSRELRLVARLVRGHGLEALTEPLQHVRLDIPDLKAMFSATETVIFPHWWHAAQRSADKTTVVVAGVLGEVLGGHYGPGMLSRGLRKAARVGRTLLDPSCPNTPLDGREVDRVYDLIRGGVQRKPALFSRELWDAGDIRSVIEADIRQDVDDLASRGVASTEQLLEAFVTEHRGAQRICTQLRSCSPLALTFMPLATPRVLAIASSLPAAAKVHNRLSARIIAMLFPPLLGVPIAASLFPASWPILAQETGRLMRAATESFLGTFHRLAPAIISRPAFGWASFEFLREGGAITEIHKALQSGIWDWSEIDRRDRAMASGEWPFGMHSTLDMALKALTVEYHLQ